MSIRENIRAFIVDNFLFGDDLGLKDDGSFLDEGFLDSTGIMQLVAYLEETFSVRVEDEELIPDNLDSINKVANYLERKAIVSR
ncbi:MAG: acyl carrier protein [Deltaproteobacteria bacterium]|nr:acyl carrier protein [Deltaproteobacteria bacterium]TLN04299.1 MAG: acyl carrier protein [bacterium]